jgi:hypothetical protein
MAPVIILLCSYGFFKCMVDVLQHEDSRQIPTEQDI